MWDDHLGFGPAALGAYQPWNLKSPGGQAWVAAAQSQAEYAAHLETLSKNWLNAMLDVEVGAYGAPE